MLNKKYWSRYFYLWTSGQILKKDQMIFEQENQGKRASCYKKVFFFILPFTKKV